MTARRRIAAALLALLATAASGQAYRWVDDQGRVRYSDTPPPAAAKGARRLAAPAPREAPQSPSLASVPEPIRPALEITFYTNSGCGQLCADALAHLRARAARFRLVEVETEEALAELRKVSGAMNVPVLVVGTAIQRGYDAAQYDRLLDAAGLPKAAARTPEPAAPTGRYALPAPAGAAVPGTR